MKEQKIRRLIPFTKPKEGLFNEFKNQDDEMVAAHSISAYYEMRESEYTLCTYTPYVCT